VIAQLLNRRFVLQQIDALIEDLEPRGSEPVVDQYAVPGWTLNVDSVARITDRGIPQYLDGAHEDTFQISGRSTSRRGCSG
jgi:hypothetical protein